MAVIIVVVVIIIVIIIIIIIIINPEGVTMQNWVHQFCPIETSLLGQCEASVHHHNLELTPFVDNSS